VWYFQVVHHDIWDYDIAAQPVLIDVVRDGKKIPAVVAGTKMGHIFVLHRETGKPIFPVEERPVPTSDIIGEEASRTQPFPVLPEPLGLQSISKEDAWGLTEEEKNEARKKIEQFRNNGIFTPPSIQGTLVTPGNVGGINWSGMSYDTEQEILVTNINLLAAIIKLVPREKISESGENEKGLVKAETGMQEGTPYVLKRSYLFTISNAGMMIQSKPPWGTLVAIDMKTGLKKWEVPLGYMFDPKKYPDAVSWGSINMGGTITTSGNLTFVAGSMDNHFRAFNTRTGEMVWEYLLPAGGQATPMSYEVKGKQFVVIAAGGHGKLGTSQGDYVVAFGLE
jgi:quinoprotein glucose dehydrogenase